MIKKSNNSSKIQKISLINKKTIYKICFGLGGLLFIRFFWIKYIKISMIKEKAKKIIKMIIFIFCYYFLFKMYDKWEQKSNKAINWIKNKYNNYKR